MNVLRSIIKLKQNYFSRRDYHFIFEIFQGLIVQHSVASNVVQNVLYIPITVWKRRKRNTVNTR